MAFDKASTAIASVLRHEGSALFEDGDEVSRFGITLKAVKEFHPTATREVIETMTEQNASEFYWLHYWDRYHFALIEDPWVAAKVFDAAVNIGPGSAIKILQRALNDEFSADLKVDGTLGKMTAGACGKAAPISLLAAFANRLGEYYQGIALSNPKKAQYLDGWLARAWDSCWG